MYYITLWEIINSNSILGVTKFTFLPCLIQLNEWNSKKIDVWINCCIFFLHVPWSKINPPVFRPIIVCLCSSNRPPGKRFLLIERFYCHAKRKYTFLNYEINTYFSTRRTQSWLYVTHRYTCNSEINPPSPQRRTLLSWNVLNRYKFCTSSAWWG